MRAPAHPPRLAERLMERALHSPEQRHGVLGDLREEYDRLRRTSGSFMADAWYWRQAVLVFVRFYSEERRGGRGRWSGVGRGRGGGAAGLDPGASKGPSRLAGDLGQDLRFALRGLARSRAFTIIAVASLAVGIGVNAALFNVLYATWLQPVPGITDPERVAEALVVRRGRPIQEWAYPDFEDVKNADTPFELLAGIKERHGTLTTADGAQSVLVMYVSSTYFRVLGVSIATGRDFLPTEDVSPGQHPVVVISHDMWQKRLGGDRGIVGGTLVLNRTPHTVIGVAPEGFIGHRPFRSGRFVPELWVPIMQHPLARGEGSMIRDRASLWVEVLGRLRGGSTVEEATAALQTVFARLEDEYPESNEDRSARAASLRSVPAVGRAESMLGVGLLLALTATVLVIICGNLAGMALARSAAREQEIAVRMALGSGQGRLIRFLMVEALLLALAGGGMGIALAYWATSPAFMSRVGVPVPGLSFTPHGWALGASLALTLATTLVFGLFPAIRFSNPELISSLKDDSGGGGRRVGRIHRIAASAQTGLALALLVVSGLFVRALGALDERELGFEPKRLLISRVDLSSEGYASQEEAEAFMDRVRQSLASLPGVQSVTVADGIPLDLVGNFTRVSRSDRPEEAEGRVTVEFTMATEGFFETTGIPILRGRGFEPTDVRTSEPVAVITASLAERLWPDEDALGRQVRFPTVGRDTALTYTVVGVTAHTASSRPTGDWPHLFASLRQNPRSRVLFAVRGTGEVGALIRPMQAAILDADPSLPNPEVFTSESLVSRSTDGQRMNARAAAGLGVLALLLSAIGVYGVIAFAVTSRTREIGLRLAVGASRERVLWEVLWDAVRLAVPGLVVGALAAVAAGFASGSFLLGVSPVDPVSLLAPTLGLFIVVVLASLVPARKASGIDPMESLRTE